MMRKCARISAPCRLITVIGFSLVLLCTTLLPVYGGGRREQDLSRADALIEAREFDEAIRFLTDFTRRYPDQFDDAHKRIQEILRIREEFNRTAEELIEAIINEPENDEKLFELSERLYALENPNNPLLINFVSRTREIALFNINRNELRDIMETAGIQIDNGDYAGAMRTYSNGLGFMREEFFSAGYGSDIENTVTEETEKIASILADFQQAGMQMEIISEEMILAANAGNTLVLEEGMTRLIPAMNRYINLKHELYSTSVVYEQILNFIKTEDPEMGDRNHLAFVSTVINGRESESSPEGMLGVFAVYWTNTIGAAANSFTAYIENTHSASLAAFNAKQYDTVLTSLNSLVTYAKLLPQFIHKHFELFEDEMPPYNMLFGNYILNEDSNQYLEAYALNEANNALLQAANIIIDNTIDRSSFNLWQAGEITTSQSLEREQRVREQIINTRAELSEVLDNTYLINRELLAYENVPYVTNTHTAIGNLRAELITEEQLSVQRYYSIAHNNFRVSVNNRRTELERSKDLLDGISGESPAYSDTEMVYRYPAEALQILTAMIGSVEIDIDNGNAILTQYTTEAPEITSTPDIASIRINQQSSVNELNNILSEGLLLAETARSRMAQAEALRAEAARLFSEAQAAYQRQDFNTARERIQRTADRINESLEIQASALLRQQWDQQLLTLGQAVTQAENELIIAQVRTLVNNARNQYYAGNFHMAEDSLLQARNRWRVTNSDENAEVVYWLEIVRTALSVRSSRTIPPTAPLYAEMSQLLSQAQRNYDEGVRQINGGMRALGLERFEEARRLTREIRLMFPLNQEAGLLELRIEQFTDPATFNASFDQRIRDAVNGTRQRTVESFADLQNLAEINPNYPGIRAIITQAEIDMGYRPPPPNPADVALSSQLTVLAGNILNANNRVQFEIALTQINEAILLNPNNTEAVRIKDRLLVMMSAPSAIVLSSADEADYQRAVREYQSGNYLAAYTIVERLMQNTQNRNITKLIELRRRIQSVL